MYQHYVLPVEIEDRELDAKLLLALKLLNISKRSEIILGNDKYITYILHHKKSPSILLDKSCSNIMFEARFRPVLKSNGKVAVSDEEGVNNIPNNYESLFHRFDPRSTQKISKFFSWGSLDEQLAQKVGINPSKIIKCGNCRLDLLSEQGKNFYSNKISAFKEIFGEFVLVNDNFVVEHYDSNYRPPPRSHLTEDEASTLVAKQAKYQEMSSEERSNLTKLIKYYAEEFPRINFVIRPHPVSDPSYWFDNFSKLRNVFVIYKGSVEPWLFASKALISCGCSTALQAGLAKIPIFHCSLLNTNSRNSLSSSLGKICSRESNLLHYENKIIDSNYNFVAKNLFIDKYSSDIIASHLNSLSDASTLTPNPIDSQCIKYWKSIIHLNSNMSFEPKWREAGYSVFEIKSKVLDLMKCYNVSMPNIMIKKISSTLFILSNGY